MAGLRALLFLFALLAAAPAAAAEIGELHQLFGVRIGDPAPLPASFGSILSRGPCGCPDFCTRDLTEVGPNGAISVRRERHADSCRTVLITAEDSPQRGGGAAGIPADLFGRSPEEIAARYGTPLLESEVGGRQFVYCNGQGGETVFTGFLFDAGRLHAIRVGLGRCPGSAFVPGGG